MQTFLYIQFTFVKIIPQTAAILYRMPYEADFFLQLRKFFFAPAPIYFPSWKNSIEPYFEQTTKCKDLFVFFVFLCKWEDTKDLNKSLSKIQYYLLIFDKIGSASG